MVVTAVFSTVLQEVLGRALVRRVVPVVEPRRPLPHRRGARGLPRSLDMEHGGRELFLT